MSDISMVSGKAQIMEQKKHKKLSKTGRILTDTVLVFALCVAGYSGFKLYEGLSTYNQSKNVYDEIRETAVKQPEPQKQEDSSIEEIQEESEDIDHAALSAINPDYVGWIRMKNSYIDYPMVQGTDNSFYLDHLYTKEYNYVGSVFLDCNNNRNFSDRNTVIYAHNVKNGTMFMEIAKFEDPSYYAEHDEIEIFTQQCNYKLYPVAGILTTGSDNYVSFNFGSDEEFMNYVSYFTDHSTFVSRVELQPTDQTVLLSTCSYSLEDGRYALLCKTVKQ